MAKLKDDPITHSDLMEFLNDCSDFAFEIKAVKELSDLGYECEHGGTYIDHATKKARQFDIRAVVQFDNTAVVQLAVECKNIKPNSPLLLSCLPRTVEESFHHVIVSINRYTDSIPRIHSSQYPEATVVRIPDKASIYQSNGFVGKSSDQVGRDNNEKLTTNDSDVFSKWAQSLSSAQDLTERAYYEPENLETPICYSLVLPILVIPDGMLWQTVYDHFGNRTHDPEQVERCSMFIDRCYSVASPRQTINYSISHLEFVTMSGLKELAWDIKREPRKFIPIATINELHPEKSWGSFLQ